MSYRDDNRYVQFMGKMDNLDENLSGVRDALRDSNSSLSSIDESTSAMTQLLGNFVQQFARDRAMQIVVEQQRWEFQLRWDTWDLEQRKAFIEELDRQRAIEIREAAEAARIREQKKKVEAAHKAEIARLEGAAFNAANREWADQFASKVRGSIGSMKALRLAMYVLNKVLFLGILASWVYSAANLAAGVEPSARVFMFLFSFFLVLIIVFLPPLYFAWWLGPTLFAHLFRVLAAQILRSRGVPCTVKEAGWYFQLDKRQIRRLKASFFTNVHRPMY